MFIVMSQTKEGNSYVDQPTFEDKFDTFEEANKYILHLCEGEMNELDENDFEFQTDDGEYIVWIQDDHGTSYTIHDIG